MNPSPRLCTNMQSDSPSVKRLRNSPIPQFDFQLKVLSDSYLSFFNERRRIEEAYIDSMLKLHKRTRTIDLYLDDRPDRGTVRAAWTEIRDNVERETNARQAFLSTLNDEVIGPLTALKETQERTRKRVKEDIKESASAHTDFAESQLPKLKRAYLRKCQEVEDHKAASSAFSSNSSQAPIFSDSQRPSVTSPQPLRPMERKASLGGSSARSRSPPAVDRPTLSDLAYQGKRQLNQLMNLLDKGNTAKDGMGGRSTESSLKTVRAKREADEADKEYRKAVYRLETLRLRRAKILQAGYNSLERFYYEATETVKKALESYTDNMLATTSTQSALAAHARQMVEQVSPAADLSILAAQIPRLFQAAVPPQVFYHNYFVGECRDLSFGLSLSDYAATRGLSDGAVPKVLKLCIDEVEGRGMFIEGIYRISGRHAVVQELQHKLERDEKNFTFNSAADDIHAVASLLKAYLRSLPEPLFKFPLQERIQHTEDYDDHNSNNFAVIRSKIRRLPTVHRNSLKAVVEHLARVASHSDKNKMDAKNLAISFGTVVFGEEDIAQGNDLLAVSTAKDTVMEDLIENAALLFQADDRAQTSGLRQSPPSTSQSTEHADPVVPSFSSASMHSKSASAHSLNDDIPSSSTTVHSRTSDQHDFAPELPPRPAGSIHPSARKPDTSLSPPRSRPPSMPPPPTGESGHTLLAQNVAPRSCPPSMPSLPPRPDSLMTRAALAMSTSSQGTQKQDSNPSCFPRSRHPSLSSSGRKTSSL
ncbi:hypothetical protein K488DRAFT_76750 [Vararia minispora EC-137]|uniref:Uncharacterized protein n=1 Tax=Vararia minispora EC-137 TaxID=1314806 RepID=A0ACB8QTY6_9AGAM|nr:hypothetical protein K488DRAFT_76750 [Vararia minispora EC-137]